MRPTCFCGREARGFAWRDPNNFARVLIGACSIDCLNIIVERSGIMTHVTDIEYAAVEAASENAGGFLDKLGKTDIATLTGEEWLDFILTTYMAVCNRVSELSRDDVPF